MLSAATDKRRALPAKAFPGWSRTGWISRTKAGNFPKGPKKFLAELLQITIDGVDAGDERVRYVRFIVLRPNEASKARPPFAGWSRYEESIEARHLTLDELEDQTDFRAVLARLADGSARGTQPVLYLRVDSIQRRKDS